MVERECDMHQRVPLLKASSEPFQQLESASNNPLVDPCEPYISIDISHNIYNALERWKKFGQCSQCIAPLLWHVRTEETLLWDKRVSLSDVKRARRAIKNKTVQACSHHGERPRKKEGHNLDPDQSTM